MSRLPRIARRTLANGLDLRAVSHQSVPVASIVLLVPGGSAVDPRDAHGLVSLTAGLLDGLWTRGLLGADRREALRAITVDDLRDVLGTAAWTSALTVARAGADLPTRAERDAAQEGVA